MLQKVVDRIVLGTIGFLYGIAVAVLRRIKRT